MSKYTEKELKDILDKHIRWLKKDCVGWEKMRAYLSGADLRWADLSGADLRGADLSEADLSGAYLSGADLSRAYLRGAYLSRADLRGAYLRGAYLSRAYLSEADLSGAYLSGADLSGADLRGADLSEADLSGAYLRGADLRGAYLRGADLSGADLRGAYLSRAYLSRAYLSGADLRGADLRGAKDIPFIPTACPDAGGFIGWKKAHGMIVKLYIPEDAQRSSATGRKCRCDKAVVLEIQSTDGKEVYVAEAEVKSDYDGSFVYKVGETVAVSNFDEDRFNECAPGIHFFINRQEAVNY